MQIKGTLENELTKVGVSFEEYNFMTGDTRIFQEVFTNEVRVCLHLYNYTCMILYVFTNKVRMYVRMPITV